MKRAEIVRMPSVTRNEGGGYTILGGIWEADTMFGIDISDDDPSFLGWPVAQLYDMARYGRYTGANVYYERKRLS